MQSECDPFLPVAAAELAVHRRFRSPAQRGNGGIDPSRVAAPRQAAQAVGAQLAHRGCRAASGGAARASRCGPQRRHRAQGLQHTRHRVAARWSQSDDLTPGCLGQEVGRACTPSGALSSAVAVYWWPQSTAGRGVSSSYALLLATSHRPSCNRNAESSRARLPTGSNDNSNRSNREHQG